MHILVTGATGFIGSALVADLLSAGHTVTGVARSDASAAALERAGAAVHRGTLTDPEGIAEAAAVADGVAHLAFNHDDFTAMAESGKADLAIVEAVGRVLAGSDRPFVVTSGSALGAGLATPLTEDVAVDTTSPFGAARGPSEEATLALAERGVRSSLVRLAPSVHGVGDVRGFVPTLARVARDRGVSGYVGEGTNVWPAVHRLDAARLFLLALEAAPAGTRLHGTAEVGVRTRDIAEAIGRRLGLPTASIDPAEAMEHFGWIGGFAQVDNPTTNDLTRALLGWEPTGPTLLDDLDAGVYDTLD